MAFTHYDLYRAAVRERFGRVTPFRLGLVMGKAGADMPSPYPATSIGTKHYKQGIEHGIKAAAAERSKQ